MKKRHKPPVNQITDGLYKVKWICGSIIGLLNCYLLEVFFQLKTNHCSEEYPLLRTVNQITDGLYKVKWICGSIIGLLNCYLLEVFFQLKTNHCSEEYPLLRKESDR